VSLAAELNLGLKNDGSLIGKIMGSFYQTFPTSRRPPPDPKHYAAMKLRCILNQGNMTAPFPCRRNML